MVQWLRMEGKKILILGGTAEAREIASRLLDNGHDVTTSLAGVTTSPVLPKGKLRVGGFGGVSGLVDYLKAEHVEVLLDATHPFAAQMSAHAFEAAKTLATPLIRFERPVWDAQSGDQWIAVSDLKAAASTLPMHAVVLVTTGRKDIAPFLSRDDLSGFIRTVEPLAETLPTRWQEILDRPPQTIAGELDLMRRYSITHLVTKNAGGNRTRAKLDAARELGVSVIMVQRPNKPECETFSDVEALAMRLGTTVGIG
jgi:precorrin-6A/cobalt-precorrin-6A reductase